MDALTVITPEITPQSAIEAGLSPFRCNTCNSHVTEEVVRYSQIWHDEPLLKCENCDNGLQAGSITLSPSSAHLLNTEIVRETIWYHATCVEDWFQKVSTGHGMEKQEGDFLYVHVGSEAASRDIAEDKYFKHPRDGERIMLYQVRLKETANLSSSLVNDGEGWWDYSSVTQETAASIGGDAVTYLNRWESPGSISLLVDARQLELVSVQQIYSTQYSIP